MSNAKDETQVETQAAKQQVVRPPHKFENADACRCYRCGHKVQWAASCGVNLNNDTGMWPLSCDYPTAYCAKCKIQFSCCPECSVNHTKYQTCGDPEDLAPICFGKFVGLYNCDQVWRPNYDPDTTKEEDMRIDRPGRAPLKATPLPGEDQEKVELYVGDINPLYTGYSNNWNTGIPGFDETDLTGHDGGFSVHWYCYECKHMYSTTDK